MVAFIPRLARLGLLASFFLLLPAPLAPLRAAPGQPVTIKELCLMLRGGYTGEEVLRETAARPLLDPVDADAEKSLLAAGADANLVASLKASHPTLTADQASAARAHQQLLDLRNDATRRLQAARLQQAATPAAAQGGATAQFTDPHYVEDLLRGKLVNLRDEQLKPLGSSALEGKKLFGLYYSCFVSRAGHDFSPQLVQFYQAAVARHPEFEIVLVSSDRNVFDMQNVMHEFQMPWPALAFDQISQVRMVGRFAEASKASRLVVVNNFGRILADYRVAVGNINLPLMLPDLQKVLDNPARASVLSPPPPAVAADQ